MIGFYLVHLVNPVEKGSAFGERGAPAGQLKSCTQA